MPAGRQKRRRPRRVPEPSRAYGARGSEVEPDPREPAVVDEVARCELLRIAVVALEAAFDEDAATAAEAVRRADLVLRDPVLELVADPERARVRALDARIVPEAAEQRERVVEVGKLFDPEAPAVLLRVAVVRVPEQVADADVDPRL